LNLKDALFEERKSLYTKKYNKEQDIALPEAILCEVVCETKCQKQNKTTQCIAPIAQILPLKPCLSYLSVD